MKISHIAIWTRDMEGMRNFYVHYFDAGTKESYYNHSRDFKSCIVTFSSDCELVLMEMPGIPANRNDYRKQAIGLNHFALSVGSKLRVDKLTEAIKKDGFKIISEPHTAANGQYIAIVLDPENNRIVITV